MDVIYLTGIVLFAVITLFVINGCSRLGGEL